MNLHVINDDTSNLPADAPERHGLNEHAHPTELINWAAERFAHLRPVLTSAFGMEGCALIDMVARTGIELEVTYLDTHFFFQETLDLKDRLAAKYPNLSFVNRGTDYTPEQQAKEHGEALWRSNPDQCCHIRKVVPMAAAMEGKDFWYTGLRRSQSASRANINVLEWDWKFKLFKFNPFAYWERSDVWEYIQKNDVPYNPLHEKGYPSVGCTHCTHAVKGAKIGEYTRAGRWEGMEKTECGLHGGAGI